MLDFTHTAKVHLTRGDIDVVNFDAISMPRELAAEYSVCFSTVFSKHHANLDALNMADVIHANCGLSFALEDGQIEAALYYERTYNDAGLNLKVMGMIAMGRISGLIAPILAASVLAENRASRMPVSAKAVVRIMPGGDVNIGSAKSLTRAGFFPTKFSMIKIGMQNTHLMLSKEPGDGFIQTMIMEAKPADLIVASKRILSDWTEHEVRHVA